jgi:hypothetical protein
MANGEHAWQLGLSYEEAPSDTRGCLVYAVADGGRLPNRRGKRLPCASGEREYGATAVCCITDQHGLGCGDFYALSAIGA